jgi:hypothetical protein
MAAYANPDRAADRVAAEKAIATAKTCPVPEIDRLGRTLSAWRTEFLARFDQPTVSNGPTECLNLKMKTPSGQPAATGPSPTTVCDYFSTTDLSAKINKRHGSEPPTQQDCVVSIRRVDTTSR